MNQLVLFISFPLGAGGAGKFRINEPFINTKRPAGSFGHMVGDGFICVEGVSALQSWALVPSALSCPPCGLGAPGLVSNPLVTTALTPCLVT